MKHIKVYLIAFLVSVSPGIFAQYISMNTSGAPGSASAILDLSANPSLGFLTPAVTFTSSVDVTTIPSPAQGLIVYNPTTSTSNGLFGAGFYYWSGSQWDYLYNNGNGPLVTSVGLSMPSIFSVSGSPVTSSGTLGVSLNSQSSNLIFAGPSSGSPASPAFRALTLADLPTGILNSALASSSVTFSGTGVTFSPSPTVALGGTITITGAGGSVTSVGPGTEGGTASGSSGLTFTPNPITGTGTIALAALPSSPAGTYTSTTQVPVVTVNTEGQITNVTQTTLTNTGTVTSVAAGTSGANTNSSGLTFSPNPITSTGNIAIATGGVSNSMLVNPTFSITATAPLTVTNTNPALGGTTTVGLTTPLAVAYGGTGIATAPTQYGVAYAATTTTYSTTAAGASGTVLTSNGTSAPTFQSLSALAGSNYIFNQTTAQNPGNFYIQTAAGNVGGVIEGASGQTADLLDFDNSSGTPLAYFDNSGNLTTQGLTTTGTGNINISGNNATNIGTGTGIVVIGNSTGKVGIGTTTPNSLLTVNGITGIGLPSTSTSPLTGVLSFYNIGNTGNESIEAGNTTHTYSLTLPVSQGSSNSLLSDNGSGVLNWSSIASLYSANNGLNYSPGTVKLGGAMLRGDTIVENNNSMAFDLGTGSAHGTGVFSITNGGTGTTYLYAAGNTTNNVPAIGVGNKTPGANLLNVSVPTATSGTGNGISIAAQAGSSGSAGGNVSLTSGTGGNNAAGGSVTITAGTSSGNANGSNIVINPSALNGSGSNNGGVAINNTGAIPSPSALVDMSSSTSGLLIPRMTTAQMNAINNPAVGLTVYATDTYCFMYWTGGSWTSISCACTGAPSTPTSFTGTNNTTVCAGSTQTYTSSLSTGATSYQWIIPAGGGTILSGQGTNTLTVLIGNVASTTISVYTLNSCGSSGQLSETLTINPIPSGGTFTGNDTVCTGIPVTFTLSGVSNVTNYTWTVPTGWTGTSTTYTDMVTPNTTNGNVTCTPYNGSCPGSTYAISVITTTTPANPTPVSGLTSACPGNGAQTYICTPISNATSYIWSVTPTNSNITVGASTTYSNTVNWNASAPDGTYNVTVQPTNSCGTATGYTWTVTAGPPATPTGFGGTTSICLGTTYTYSVTSASGVSSYNWAFPAGSVAINPQVTTTNTVSITYIAFPTCGNLSITESNSAGCVSSPLTEALSISTACTYTFAVGAITAWPVPCGVSTLTVAIAGGGGGNGTDVGGVGAKFTETVNVTATHTLEVCVGAGGTEDVTYVGGGGGGASYVWDAASSSYPIIIAGGGGGGGRSGVGSACTASLTPSASGTDGGAAGTGGNGGGLGSGYAAGGGGGFLGAGTGDYGLGGNNAAAGAAGGGGYDGGAGGFGGGGGSGIYTGGGGGGWSGGGGGGGTTSKGYGGGGGSSGYYNASYPYTTAGDFVAPVSITTTAAQANGSVTITY